MRPQQRMNMAFVAVAMIAAVLILWATTLFVVPLLVPGLAERALFGETFGWVEALFSGLAFAGLILALLMQREDLHNQRLELALQHEEMSRSIVAQEEATRSLEQQLDAQRHIQSYSRLLDAEMMMVDTPEVLALHGVRSEDLERIGATPEEVLYVLRSVRAGMETSRLEELEGQPHVLSPYRRKQLEDPKFRAIWTDVLRGHFIFRAPFVESVDRYIAQRRWEPDGSS